MMFLGTEPTDDAEAQVLIVQAFACAERLDWQLAAEYLESAAVVASSALLDSIIETLGIFYVRANQYLKLAQLIAFATQLTPTLVIGGLLVERNRQCGLSVGLSHQYSLPDLLLALRQYVAKGQYSLGELSIICSLLTQIGNVNTALPLLDAMIDMLPARGPELDTGLDEELVTAVLALALDKKLKREAEALVNKLERLSGKWPIRVARYRILLGKAEVDSIAPGQDKVTDFLRGGGDRMSKSRRARS